VVEEEAVLIVPVQGVAADLVVVVVAEIKELLVVPELLILAVAVPVVDLVMRVVVLVEAVLYWLLT
jgi:hypothetical protein